MQDYLTFVWRTVDRLRADSLRDAGIDAAYTSARRMLNEFSSAGGTEFPEYRGIDRECIVAVHEFAVYLEIRFYLGARREHPALRLCEVDGCEAPAWVEDPSKLPRKKGKGTPTIPHACAVCRAPLEHAPTTSLARRQRDKRQSEVNLRRVNLERLREAESKPPMTLEELRSEFLKRYK